MTSFHFFMQLRLKPKFKLVHKIIIVGMVIASLTAVYVQRIGKSFLYLHRVDRVY